MLTFFGSGFWSLGSEVMDIGLGGDIEILGSWDLVS